MLLVYVKLKNVNCFKYLGPIDIVFIRLEANEVRLHPNLGFTFERALTAFTRSGITSLKVNRFG